VSAPARVLRGKSQSRGVANEEMEAAAHHRREHVDPLPARRRRRMGDSVVLAIASRPVTHLPTDPDSREWLATLRSSDARTHAEAVGRLHELLLRAARFEVGRRSSAAHHVGREQLDDVAHQSAHDALVAVLAKLDDFRGESRFTTWAYKFALLEAGVKMRRRAWNDREVTLEPANWPGFADPRSSPHHDAQMAELLAAVGEAIAEDLTPHQREVLVAVTLDDVPIDVLAERLQTTRGALYKTLHDARRRLRSCLAARALDPDLHDTGTSS
jgi:RNA polymerase sigma-70 factor, ECF subfamily